MRSVFGWKRPELAQKIGTAYVYIVPGRSYPSKPYAVVYVWLSARAKNPHYAYAKTLDETIDVINSYVALADKKGSTIRARRQDRKASQALKLGEAIAECTVGSIYRTSWGYEQTNIEYFEVVARPSRCFVILREVAQESEGAGFMSARVRPIPGDYIGDPIRRKIGPYGITLDSVRTAWKMDDSTKSSLATYYA